MDADVPRLHRGVGVDHVDAVEGDPQLLGDDHGEDGLRALADLARPRDEGHLAEIVELDDGAAAVGAVDARPAAHVEHPRVPDAPLPARAERSGHRLPDVPRHRVEALGQGARRDPETQL